MNGRRTVKSESGENLLRVVCGAIKATRRSDWCWRRSGWADSGEAWGVGVGGLGAGGLGKVLGPIRTLNWGFMASMKYWRLEIRPTQGQSAGGPGDGRLLQSIAPLGRAVSWNESHSYSRRSGRATEKELASQPTKYLSEPTKFTHGTVHFVGTNSEAKRFRNK